MKELFEKAELKGIPKWQVYNLLHKYNWELYLHDPIPGQEWGNRERKNINKRAIEQALIELDYTI